MKNLLFLAFSSILYSNSAFALKTNLDTLEVQVLKQIWEKLRPDGKMERGFNKDPCSGEGNRGISVDCDCSFESNTTCRVIGIRVTSQNVSTALPSEFAKFKYLQNLDLDRNYFRGAIPSEWATMRLRTLSLMGNQLYGPFPKALPKITTLRYLSIEGNNFSNSIPEEIADLKNLQKLRISDNNFSGKIPNFISGWTQIDTLHIQGCSFEGPIPSSISVLTELQDLRISDLKGGASTFPSLENMIQLSILVLRNCFINGPIPKYVAFLRNLRTLDLSFNNLTGEIPPSFYILGHRVESIYLTQNDLTGLMPRWILSSMKNVDVSYNNFSWNSSSGPYRCAEGTANMVESLSLSANEHDDIHPCLKKDFPCTKPKEHKVHSLYINCGGEEVNIYNTIKYDADTERRGASTYYNNGNWAFSSTGSFLNDDYDVYILYNTSNLHNISISDTELYTKARTAGISLTYYGLCLVNGNYTVRLHFAEIVFTQDNSFNSLGRRVFDVYVQGELKIKDFDIVKDAGGTGRAVIKSYIVNVKNNTLKIQLYWAGKGTTGIPVGGSYGPIISAISVDPNFVNPYFGKSIHTGIIIGIVCGVSLLLIITVILWRKGYIMTKNQPIELGPMSHNTSFS